MGTHKFYTSYKNGVKTIVFQLEIFGFSTLVTGQKPEFLQLKDKINIYYFKMYFLIETGRHSVAQKVIKMSYTKYVSLIIISFVTLKMKSCSFLFLLKNYFLQGVATSGVNSTSFHSIQ